MDYRALGVYFLVVNQFGGVHGAACSLEDAIRIREEVEESAGLPLALHIEKA